MRVTENQRSPDPLRESRSGRVVVRDKRSRSFGHSRDYALLASFASWHHSDSAKSDIRRICRTRLELCQTSEFSLRATASESSEKQWHEGLAFEEHCMTEDGNTVAPGFKKLTMPLKSLKQTRIVLKPQRKEGNTVREQVVRGRKLLRSG